MCADRKKDVLLRRMSRFFVGKVMCEGRVFCRRECSITVMVVMVRIRRPPGGLVDIELPWCYLYVSVGQSALKEMLPRPRSCPRKGNVFQTGRDVGLPRYFVDVESP